MQWAWGFTKVSTFTSAMLTHTHTHTPAWVITKPVAFLKFALCATSHPPIRFAWQTHIKGPLRRIKTAEQVLPASGDSSTAYKHLDLIAGYSCLSLSISWASAPTCLHHPGEKDNVPHNEKKGRHFSIFPVTTFLWTISVSSTLCHPNFMRATASQNPCSAVFSTVFYFSWF